MSNQKKEIQIYDFLHKIDSHSNYQLNRSLEPTNNTKNLADIIHNNYDNMQLEELKSLVIKLISPNEIKSKLLKFELEHYEEKPKDLTLQEFIKEATAILLRYQHKAGGFNLEDNQWTIYTSTTKSYSILQN